MPKALHDIFSRQGPSKVAELATVKFIPNVSMLSPSASVVILRAALVVNVASTVSDRFVGAVNRAVPVVFRLPLNINVLPVKSSVPPVGVPCIVMLPPVLVI